MGTDDLTDEDRMDRRDEPTPLWPPVLDPLAGPEARAALVAELRSLVQGGVYDVSAEVVAVAIYSNATGRWEEHLI